MECFWFWGFEINLTAPPYTHPHTHIHNSYVHNRRTWWGGGALNIQHSLPTVFSILKICLPNLNFHLLPWWTNMSGNSWRTWSDSSGCFRVKSCNVINPGFLWKQCLPATRWPLNQSIPQFMAQINKNNTSKIHLSIHRKFHYHKVMSWEISNLFLKETHIDSECRRYIISIRLYITLYHIRWRLWCFHMFGGHQWTR